MIEKSEIVISRSNPEIDPHLHVWGWEIPGYLFLGGLTAGILILSGLIHLLRKDKDYPFTANIAPIFAPIILSFGMLFLFLDLAHKLYVWRLYLTFQWTSPMSWGSWALILAYPFSILFGLQQLDPQSRENIGSWLKTRRKFKGLASQGYALLTRAYSIADSLRSYSRTLAMGNVLIGGFIGIYTGILLSSFIARPFWNTPVLGFLFLASGLSAASAFIILGTKNHHEEQTLIKMDIAFLILELFLLSQIFIGYFTQSRFHNEAGWMIFGGDFTSIFWMLVVMQGILFPLFMETMELYKQFRFKIITPLSVLLGGLLLRILFVYLGQISHVELAL